jgi:hypothetical protein
MEISSNWESLGVRGDDLGQRPYRGVGKLEVAFEKFAFGLASLSIGCFVFLQMFDPAKQTASSLHAASPWLVVANVALSSALCLIGMATVAFLTYELHSLCSKHCRVSLAQRRARAARVAPLETTAAGMAPRRHILTPIQPALPVCDIAAGSDHQPEQRTIGASCAAEDAAAVSECAVRSTQLAAGTGLQQPTATSAAKDDVSTHRTSLSTGPSAAALALALAGACVPLAAEQQQPSSAPAASSSPAEDAEHQENKVLGTVTPLTAAVAAGTGLRQPTATSAATEDASIRRASLSTGPSAAALAGVPPGQQQPSSASAAQPKAKHAFGARGYLRSIQQRFKPAGRQQHTSSLPAACSTEQAAAGAKRRCCTTRCRCSTPPFFDCLALCCMMAAAACFMAASVSIGVLSFFAFDVVDGNSTAC